MAANFGLAGPGPFTFDAAAAQLPGQLTFDAGLAASPASPQPAPQPGAFSTTLPNEFFCPIGGDLMEDPVVASDGRSYSRTLIEQWFEQCRRQGLESPTSPITREPMDDRLLDNIALRLAIEHMRDIRAEAEAEAEAPSPAPAPNQAQEADAARKARLHRMNSTAATTDMGTLHELGEIFAHLDGLRELVEQCLDGWQPPQLVVVGNENSGKSTLLERLCMMPIFPHAEDLCTRMRIQVRLRRGALSAPRLDVWNNNANQQEGETIVVPMETANIDVREAMDRLLRNANSNVRGVTNEHTLILHVQSPTVPNLDLVDLPGVVLNAAAGEPDDMPHQTKKLVNDHIDAHKDHSVFLGVVDATTAPNSSVGLQLLREKDVLDKTIGVITMCDYAGAPQQKTKLRNRLEQKGDAIPLKPHGYVATMNAPVGQDGDGRSNVEKLQVQAQNEPEWFAASGFEDVIAAGDATTTALLSRINKMFLGCECRSPSLRALLNCVGKPHAICKLIRTDSRRYERRLGAIYSQQA
jgi:GTP-binding protein EngB required for normal cell division